jgi:hypothetical protein
VQQAGATVDTDFLKDFAQSLFYRIDAQTKFLGYLLIGTAVFHEINHLHFPETQFEAVLVVL